jgi:hypothetical protein
MWSFIVDHYGRRRRYPFSDPPPDEAGREIRRVLWSGMVSDMTDDKSGGDLLDVMREIFEEMSTKADVERLLATIAELRAEIARRDREGEI